MSKDLFSTKSELLAVSRILKNYVRLPFSEFNIPGAVMEGVLAHVRKAQILPTYDFVDVIDRQSGIGWQVKATLSQTPLTWKRAKIAERVMLIAKSEKSSAGLQTLGNAIIDFCNAHAKESIEKYDLKQIGYSRLIVDKNGTATYFEKLLCTRENPQIFAPKDFLWKWSSPKQTTKKEQLTSLHGLHIPTQRKWFAWHGRGENQLHFSGERAWWPSRANEDHAILFSLPSASERLTLEAFVDLLAATENPLPPTE